MSSQLLAWLAWSGYVALAPIIAISISVAYFVASPREQALGKRLAASSHGIAIALLYAVGWAVVLSGKSNLMLGTLYASCLLLPVALIVTSFFIYRGRKRIHFLQLINLTCLMWIGFVGIMLVTGESL